MRGPPHEASRKSIPDATPPVGLRPPPETMLKLRRHPAVSRKGLHQRRLWGGSGMAGPYRLLGRRARRSDWLHDAREECAAKLRAPVFQRRRSGSSGVRISGGPR
jgi:hypothetical protein